MCTRAALAASILLALGALAHPAAALSRDRCRVPGATTKLRSAEAAVLRLRRGAQRLVVCDRRSGRLHGLVTDPDTDQADPLKLAGRYLAVGIFFDTGAPGGSGSSVQVVDARTGAVVAGLGQPTAFVLSRRGAIAYVAEPGVYPDGGAEVFRVDHRGAVLLDGAFELDPRSLRLRGDVVSWQVGAQMRSARLGSASRPVSPRRLPTVRRPRA